MAKLFQSISCALLIFLCINTANAQTWQALSGHTQIPIWPIGKMPDALSHTPPESLKKNIHNPVAGKPWHYISNVSKPTMTIYSPVGKNTGASVGHAFGLRKTQYAITDWPTLTDTWLRSIGIM